MKQVQPAVKRLNDIVKAVKANSTPPYTANDLHEVMSNFEEATGADYELASQKLKIKN